MEKALNQPKQSEELCLAKHFVDQPFLSIQGDRNELTLQSPTTSAYGINLQEDILSTWWYSKERKEGNYMMIKER